MMQPDKEFEDILNECLDRILGAGETVEQCLESYPERAAELEPLLRTSVVASRALDIKPSLEFKSRARYQFQAALREMEEKKDRRFFFGLRPQWATVLVSVLALLLASSGTVYAAGDDMPDEPLYRVKLATETVQLALTPSALGKAELYARLADRRVDEIVSMAEKGKPAQIEKATGRLDAQLTAMAGLKAGWTGDEEPAMLAAPAAATAPSATTEAANNATGPVAARGPQKAQGPPERGGEDRQKGPEVKQNAKAGQQEKLRNTLSRQAAENRQALRGALDNVPEQAREALLRAIAAADNGYQRALGSLD
ncbi:DUF5667 domain-containing protein [Chloroflexota bacterium]